jgi:TRAP-type C4-dicarboxylate transport system permease large subunit
MEKMTKLQKESLATLLFIAVIITAVIKFFENVGFLTLIIVIVACVVAFLLYKAIRKKKRLAYLKQKYVNSRIVDRMVNGVIWQGETAAQLMDSLGKPNVVDKKQSQALKKEVWRYGRRGGGRYNLIVDLENGIVVNWEGKK